MKQEDYSFFVYPSCCLFYLVWHPVTCSSCPFCGNSPPSYLDYMENGSLTYTVHHNHGVFHTLFCKSDLGACVCLLWPIYVSCYTLVGCFQFTTTKFTITAERTVVVHRYCPLVSYWRTFKDVNEISVEKDDRDIDVSSVGSAVIYDPVQIVHQNRLKTTLMNIRYEPLADELTAINEFLAKHTN